MSDLINIADAIEALKNVPPAWIPCSERLPEIGQDCLITANDCGKIIVGIETFTFCGWSYYGDNAVMAWMPLPAPYGEAVKREE